jgi:drug/metabolite transporter (DMT)-like permease
VPRQWRAGSLFRRRPDRWRPRAEGGRLISAFQPDRWNILAIYGVSMMDSGRASILGYTMPMWSVLLAVWFLGERFTGRRAAGVALGMAGMALLLSGEIRALQRAPLGALLMIGAAISWAIGLVMIRKWAAGRPATSYSAWQMLIGVVPILALALFVRTASTRSCSRPAR